MATEYGYINTMKGKLYLTRFWGGSDHGVSVQLTLDNGKNYIALSKANCYDLINALPKVFDGDTVKKDE
jgi:hypothetical protein